MNSPAIRLEYRQHQTLTPRLQQAVRLLQLSSLDFAQEVRQTLDRNPFLEADEEHEPETEDEAIEKPLTAAAPEALDGEAPASLDLGEQALPPTTELDGDTPWDRDSWAGVTSSTRNNSGDGEMSVIDMMPADVSLRAHLHTQNNVRPLSERDRALTGCIIESLDDDGYLRTDLQELAQLAEMDPPVEDSEMRMALNLVQSLEPCGVAARSVSECLQLQVSMIEDAAQRDLARLIIDRYLERLAQKDLTGLARTLGRPLPEIEAVARRIRQMDPRPGWRYGNADIHFITPDVIVKKFKGSWVVTLNPAIVPRVRLNQMYADLFQRHRDAKHAELATSLQEARWTVRNVEQRFSTILSVAKAILQRQNRFLEYGPLAMKPMGLKEIAEELGLHESTVSRVTNNKYMATPCGVFELKFFFSRAMPTLSGGACSATAIRGVIKEMIEHEPPARPLSDAEIARQLMRQGLTVARRTVTKYRQLMKIPAVEQRRQRAA